MKIFVLEDDINQQFYMESTILNILKKNGWQCQFLEIYSNPQKLLDAVRERGSHQIFFLDIEIKKETQKGLEVAGQIRKLDPYALIVFVTTHSEFMPLTFRYQVSAFDFIDKGQSEEVFIKQVEKDLAYLYERKDSFQAEETFLFEFIFLKHRMFHIDLSSIRRKSALNFMDSFLRLSSRTSASIVATDLMWSIQPISLK